MNPMRIFRMLFLFVFRIRKWFLLFKISRVPHVGPYLAKQIDKVPEQIYFSGGWRVYLGECDEEMKLISIVDVGQNQFVTELRYAWDAPIGSPVIIHVNGQNIRGVMSGMRHSLSGPVYLTRDQNHWYETQMVHYILQAL